MDRIKKENPDSKPTDYIFNKDNINLGTFGVKINRIFNKVINELGLNNDKPKKSLDRIVFHTLRHTYATSLANSGMPIQLVSQSIGHSNVNMTAGRYVKNDLVKMENGIQNVFDTYLTDKKE